MKQSHLVAEASNRGMIDLINAQVMATSDTENAFIIDKVNLLIDRQKTVPKILKTVNTKKNESDDEHPNVVNSFLISVNLKGEK